MSARLEGRVFAQVIVEDDGTVEIVIEPMSFELEDPPIGFDGDLFPLQQAELDLAIAAAREAIAAGEVRFGS